MLSTSAPAPFVRSRFASEAHAELVRRLPTPFQLFRYMSGSEHLHFGLFAHPEEDLAAAQERNTKKLLAMLPQEPCRILDVGCGIGGTSILLAERGHQVVALAPDEALIGYARAMAKARGVAHRCEFHAVGLFDLPTDLPKFDVVLSQESLQYIHPIADALQRMAAFVRPGGAVVVGDQTLRATEYRRWCQFHDSEGIRGAAALAGLQLVHHEDVTAGAVPQVPVTRAMLAELRHEICEFFAPTCPDIGHHLDVCLHNGGVEGDFYRQGLLGYEHFAWVRPVV